MYIIKKYFPILMLSFSLASSLTVQAYTQKCLNAQTAKAAAVAGCIFTFGMCPGLQKAEANIAKYCNYG